MAYSVRLIEASQTRDEHLAVWERNLKLPVAARARFDWLYRDNPAGPGRLAVIDIASPDQPARTVGTAGYALRTIQMGGRVVRAAILADLAVDRAHRTAMPAIMLARAIRGDVREKHDLVYGFPNQHAAPLLLKLGYRRLGETRRYALVLRHRRHLRTRFRGPGAALVAGVALDTARAALIAARAAQVRLTHRLVWLDDDQQVDQRFDRLWEEARGDYPLIGARDAAFVRWRFLNRPDGRMDLAAIFDRRTGALDGYAAVSREGETAHVRDLFSRRRTLGPLLRLLCRAIAKRGAESISLRLCGAPALAACLSELGFRARGDQRTIIADAGTSFDALPGGTFNADTWYLTDADEDA